MTRSSVERENRERSQTSFERSSKRQSSSPDSKKGHSVSSESDDLALVRPKFAHKFNKDAVETLLEGILNEFFTDKKYQAAEVPAWTKTLSDLISAKVQGFNYKRYKLVTTVCIGEMFGGGVNVGMRCLWDAETDLYATYYYMTDNLFAVATVCGVYYY